MYVILYKLYPLNEYSYLIVLDYNILIVATRQPYPRHGLCINSNLESEGGLIELKSLISFFVLIVTVGVTGESPAFDDLNYVITYSLILFTHCHIVHILPIVYYWCSSYIKVILQNFKSFKDHYVFYHVPNTHPNRNNIRRLF